jgi:hypothetical protein
MTQHEIIKQAVDKFLAWKLPRGFAPDAGITFNLMSNEGFDLPQCWPIGTNLFTANQASAMLEHCLSDALAQVCAEVEQLEARLEAEQALSAMRKGMVDGLIERRRLDAESMKAADGKGYVSP